MTRTTCTAALSTLLLLGGLLAYADAPPVAVPGEAPGLASHPFPTLAEAAPDDAAGPLDPEQDAGRRAPTAAPFHAPRPDPAGAARTRAVVPEPASALLLLAGAGLLKRDWLRRRLVD
jgi:hypothetical protein